MKERWIRFITKQYNKYYPDPLAHMRYALATRTFKSKTDAFNFIKDNAIGGLRTIMNLAESKVERRADYGKSRSNK